MLTILLSDLHNIYRFILLLFSLNSLLLCIVPFIFQARLIDLAYFCDLHASEPPVASATLILLFPSLLPAGKEPYFFLIGVLTSFLFELTHSLIVTIDCFWLWFIFICELYTPEQNAVLHKSVFGLRKMIYTLVFCFSKYSLCFEPLFHSIWCFQDCGFEVGCFIFNTV